MSKLNQFLLYIFILSLIFFSIESASFWSGALTTRLTIAIVLLETVSLITLTVNIKHLLKIKPMVFFVILWLMLIPFTVFSNFSLFDLLSVILWPSCFLATYVLIKHDNQFFSTFSKSFLLIFFIGVYFFFIHRLDSVRNPNVVDVLVQQRTNLIYFPLLTLPWLMCIKNKLLVNSLFIFVFAITLFSLKRSATIIMILILFPYIIYHANIFRKYKIFNLVFMIILLTIFGYAFYKVNEFVGDSVVERLSTMSEDKGTGRLDIYEEVYKLQLSADFPNWLLGHGHFGVFKNSSKEMSAHNDFLEVLFDYGVIIFTIYLMIWFNVFSQMKKLYFFKSNYFIAYFASFAIFFILSMVSHLVLYPSYFIYLAIFWGAIEALDTKQLT